MADAFRYPFLRSNNYLGAYRLLPSTKAALPVMEDMQFDAVGGAINASADQTIGNVTLAAAAAIGSSAINATASQQVDPVTQSASADVIVGASAGQTIGAVTQSATAVLIITATASQTIENIALAANSTLSGGAINATANQTIDAVTIVATATVLPFVRLRGDDGGIAWNTGSARASFYEKQLAEFKEEIKQQPKPRKRAKKIAALEQKLEAIEAQFEAPAVSSEIDGIQALLIRLEQQVIDYTSFQNAVLQHIAAIEAFRAQQRKRRNRSIAIAMLMAA